MKNKTVFMTLGLFLLFFNAAVLLAASAILQGILHTQKERCLGEHYMIASSLLRDMRALDMREIEIPPFIDELMLPYLYFSQDGLTDVLLYQDGEPVYSNLDNSPVLPLGFSNISQTDRYLLRINAFYGLRDSFLNPIKAIRLPTVLTCGKNWGAGGRTGTCSYWQALCFRCCLPDACTC